MVRRRVMRALLFATIVGALGMALSCATTGAPSAKSPAQTASIPAVVPQRETPDPSIAAPTASPSPAAAHPRDVPETVVALPDLSPQGLPAAVAGPTILPLPQPPPKPVRRAPPAPKNAGSGATEDSPSGVVGSQAPTALPTPVPPQPVFLPQTRPAPRHFSPPAAPPASDSRGAAVQATQATQARGSSPGAGLAAGAPYGSGERPQAPAGSDVAVSVAAPQSSIDGGVAAVAGRDPPAQAAADKSTQTVYARPGDQITVALDGAGWIFTGNGDWKSGLQYLSRSLDSQGTTFVFRAETLGNYALSFLKQDLATGATATKSVKVSVLSDADFARALAGSAGSSSPSGVPGRGVGNGDYTQADELFQEGLLSEALAAYKENWAPGNPAINERIADLAYRLKSYDDAQAFWRQNLGPTDNVYSELAIAGLMKTAAATHNAAQLRLLLFQSKGVGQVPIAAEMLDAARFLVEDRNYELASKYLNAYLSRYAGQQGADEAYFLLGTLYQDDTPMQDARKAREYYETIANLYPTSRYYQRAMNNIIYLNRHFFEIR